MFGNYSLYIGAIKNNNSLKLDYKKLENGQINESSQSIFISKDEILPRDAVHKINASQKEIDKTYISTLLMSDDTKLVKRNLSKRLKDYATTNLNNEFDIAISKNKLFETRHYFEATGIDYIYSTFHILNSFIEKNPYTNSLIVLFFNNKGYIVILNSKGQIQYAKVVNFTTFESVKNTKFYDNDVIGQKLFDELHFFEVTDTINSVINEFYKTTNDVFIEEIRFLYTVKQLDENQIDEIKNELMLDVFYHPISIEEELFELVKDKRQHKSFIIPRKKRSKNRTKILLTFLSIIIVVLVGYLTIPLKELMQENKALNEKKEVIVQKEFSLPNHVERNLIIKNKVKDIFDIIPFDVVLKQLEITKDTSTITADFLSDDIYIKTMQPQLLKLYKDSKVDFEEKKDVVYHGVIENSGAKQVETKMKIYKETYITDEFIPIIRVTEQLETLFPKDTKINFKSSFKSDVITFNYAVSIVVKDPKVFFDIIDRLNNELYSIHISYPLTFTNTEAGIQIDFILQFHQPK
ncbi:hypothetical protein CPU12_08535 [Malaciobacter molluscorum LMG 25693]|uniref:Uncharacterized protein n=1 Tax=Malaciobacter molluscorum LMG 25693 TaxID=870501 RepID=A0A2G1DH27_9BACT|nr:hypothetical protein [Malaciobacter molluscorum]AXX93392.1 hypothetical protein AMOL_2450 [Malaciobacter molluscorum LMG 25693]PHO17795.1 hypothetical protein CPU12_08535 [Malaciobacter molluscorum LMG 25693]